MSATKPKKRRISELSSSRIIEILQHELKNVKFPTEINSEKLLGGDPKIFFQIFKHLVFSVSDVLTNFFVKRGSFNTKSSVHFLRQLFLVGEKEFGLTPPFTLSEFLTDKFSHEKAKSGFDPLSQTTVIPTSEFKKTYGVRKTSPIKTNSSSNSSNSTSVNFKKNVRFKQNNLIDEGEDDVGYGNGNENKNKNGKQNEDEDDFYYNPNSEKNGEYQNKYNYQKTKKVGWESPIISHVEEFSNTSMSTSGSEYGEVTEMMFQTSFDRLEKWLKSQFELIDLKIEKSSEKIHNSIERIDKRVSKLDREVKQLKSQLRGDGNGENTTTKGILKNSNYGHRSMYLNINNGMNSDNFLTNSPKSKRNSKNNYQNY